MITESQRTELSEALYNALLRRLKGETDEDRALIDSADISGLIDRLVQL